MAKCKEKAYKTIQKAAIVSGAYLIHSGRMYSIIECGKCEKYHLKKRLIERKKHDDEEWFYPATPKYPYNGLGSFNNYGFHIKYYECGNIYKIKHGLENRKIPWSRG